MLRTPGVTVAGREAISSSRPRGTSRRLQTVRTERFPQPSASGSQPASTRATPLAISRPSRPSHGWSTSRPSTRLVVAVIPRQRKSPSEQATEPVTSLPSRSFHPSAPAIKRSSRFPRQERLKVHSPISSGQSGYSQRQRPMIGSGRIRSQITCAALSPSVYDMVALAVNRPPNGFSVTCARTVV